VIAAPEQWRTLWRVGYYADPLGFTPLELYQFSHRFDDVHRRFRTVRRIFTAFSKSHPGKKLTPNARSVVLAGVGDQGDLLLALRSELGGDHLFHHRVGGLLLREPFLTLIDR